MTIRIIQGVAFEIISPSFYQLADAPRCDLSYLGDGWWLQCPDESDQPRYQQFSSRDAAVAAIAQAYAEMGR